MKQISFALAFFTVAAASASEVPRAPVDADYRPLDMEAVLIGRDLFYDPILSGNRTVACATCHHPAFATADAVSLSFGDGGLGLGPDRVADPDNRPEKRIPRNAPALFNLGAYEFTVMFHDGRLEADADRPGGLRTPMDADMVTGFANVLSAQTMFPVLSRDEMAGSFRENDVARAVRQGRITGQGGAWDLLAARVADIPAYADRFIAHYDGIDRPEDIGFTDISNAIADFMAWEWRSDSSPFDAVLRGEATLTGAAADGMALFYGEVGCGTCHSGPFLTDHDFHAMAAPQIGPGKAADFESHQRDEGRFRVTGDPADLYAFRTPSLRNVALTGPWGHAGGHGDLAGFVADHADPVAALGRYDRQGAVLPPFDGSDFRILDSAEDLAAIRAAVTTPPTPLTGPEVMAIVAFLETLTDPAAIDGRLGIPDSVPSGLTVPTP